MRPRKVMVMIELESNIPIEELRETSWWQIVESDTTAVRQVQANVITESWDPRFDAKIEDPVPFWAENPTG